MAHKRNCCRIWPFVGKVRGLLDYHDVYVCFCLLVKLLNKSCSHSHGMAFVCFPDHLSDCIVGIEGLPVELLGKLSSEGKFVGDIRECFCFIRCK